MPIPQPEIRPEDIFTNAANSLMSTAHEFFADRILPNAAPIYFGGSVAAAAIVVLIAAHRAGIEAGTDRQEEELPESD